MMPTATSARAATAAWIVRLLRFPLIRILVALLFIALPFAAVAIPLNLFVVDKSLKKAGALLLTAIILCAYYGYVRWVEKRAVTELSRGFALRELGAGVLLGALLLSLSIGVLAALGVYQVIWNFTQGGIFSAAVSGGKTTGLLQGQMIGPAWLTGGPFGAEASVVALVVCTIAGLLFVIAAKRSGHVIQPYWSARNSVKSTT
jgi:hypothetical protein